MATTVYVIDHDPEEQAWIQTALAASVESEVGLDGGAALLARLPVVAGSCLVASTDPDEAATLELVRALRRRGETLPVIVLGPHSAFRTAVDIARLDATDFLERPVSVRQLLAAVRQACPGVK